MDQASGRVVVTVDSTVSRAEIAKIKKMAGGNAGAIEVERADGVFKPLLSAGDAIYGGNYRCSLGFNVVSGSHLRMPMPTFLAGSAGGRDELGLVEQT